MHLFSISYLSRKFGWLRILLLPIFFFPSFGKTLVKSKKKLNFENLPRFRFRRVTCDKRRGFAWIYHTTHQPIVFDRPCKYYLIYRLELCYGPLYLSRGIFAVGPIKVHIKYKACSSAIRTCLTRNVIYNVNDVTNRLHDPPCHFYEHEVLDSRNK